METGAAAAEDVSIRPGRVSDAAGIARVRVDTWRTTYRDILSSEYLDSLTYESHAANWRSILIAQGSLGYTYVAESAGEVVGFALGGMNRTPSPGYAGELYAIYLLESFQKRGIGRQLMSVVARRLMDEGMSSMLVWVLARNSARSFYETLGGRYLFEKELFLGRQQVKEVAYGWDDIRLLVNSEQERYSP